MQTLSKTLRTTFLILSCSFFLFTSCEKREQSIKLRINQFKQTAVDSGPKLALSVQKEANIGSNSWEPLYCKIAGFDYEPGFIYDLLVTDAKILNPAPGENASGYRLLQVVSKTPTNKPFDLNLKIVKNVFVNGNQQAGFNLLAETPIDCNNLCNELAQALNNDPDSMIGKFILNPDGSIKLLALTVN